MLSTATPPVVPPPHDATLRLLVSRTRPPALASYLADTLDAELVPLGSAGAKTMAVVQGLADVYAHSGGQYEWDSAAPVGVATAAGCHCSRLDGAPLVYNRPDPYLPDLLVCRPELADRGVGNGRRFTRPLRSLGSQGAHGRRGEAPDSGAERGVDQ